MSSPNKEISRSSSAAGGLLSGGHSGSHRPAGVSSAVGVTPTSAWASSRSHAPASSALAAAVLATNASTAGFAGNNLHSGSLGAMVRAAASDIPHAQRRIRQLKAESKLIAAAKRQFQVQAAHPLSSAAAVAAGPRGASPPPQSAGRPPSSQPTGAASGQRISHLPRSAEGSPHLHQGHVLASGLKKQSAGGRVSGGESSGHPGDQWSDARKAATPVEVQLRGTLLDWERLQAAGGQHGSQGGLVGGGSIPEAYAALAAQQQAARSQPHSQGYAMHAPIQGHHSGTMASNGTTPSAWAQQQGPGMPSSSQGTQGHSPHDGQLMQWQQQQQHWPIAGSSQQGQQPVQHADQAAQRNIWATAPDGASAAAAAYYAADAPRRAFLAQALPTAVLANPALGGAAAHDDPLDNFFADAGGMQSSSGLHLGSAKHTSGQLAARASLSTAGGAVSMSPAEESAVRALAMLQPGTVAYEHQLEHVLHLSKLRFQRERLEQEAEVTRTRARLTRETLEMEKEYEHQHWVLAQKRQYKQRRLLNAVDEALQQPVLGASAAEQAAALAQRSAPGTPHAVHNGGREVEYDGEEIVTARSLVAGAHRQNRHDDNSRTRQALGTPRSGYTDRSGSGSGSDSGDDGRVAGEATDTSQHNRRRSTRHAGASKRHRDRRLRRERRPSTAGTTRSDLKAERAVLRAQLSDKAQSFEAQLQQLQLDRERLLRDVEAANERAMAAQTAATAESAAARAAQSELANATGSKGDIERDLAQLTAERNALRGDAEAAMAKVDQLSAHAASMQVAHAAALEQQSEDATARIQTLQAALADAKSHQAAAAAEADRRGRAAGAANALAEEARRIAVMSRASSLPSPPPASSLGPAPGLRGAQFEDPALAAGLITEAYKKYSARRGDATTAISARRATKAAQLMANAGVFFKRPDSPRSSAAASIQKNYRKHLIRRALRGDFGRMRSSTPRQADDRGAGGQAVSLAALAARRGTAVEQYAASRIQGMWRGQVARKAFETLRIAAEVKRKTMADMVGPAFIRQPPVVPAGTALHPGDGFDVYVDGARFLPDNVTISKVVVRAMTRDFKSVGRTVEGLGQLDSESMSPAFKAYVAFRSRYREPELNEDGTVKRTLLPFDPTMTLVLRVDTIESRSHAHQVVGYGLLNCFVAAGARYNHEQPQSLEDGVRCTLNEGAFQIPLFQGPPQRSQPLDADVLYSAAAKVPCATLLVRIVPVKRTARVKGMLKSAASALVAGARLARAAASGVDAATGTTESVDDAASAVTRKAMPRAQWSAAGLLVPPPVYSSAKYDSFRCRPTDSELALFPKRSDIEPPTLRELLEDYFIEARSEAEALSAADGGSNFPGVVVAGSLSDIGGGQFGVPPPPDTGDSQLVAWCKMRLRGSPVSMLDYRYMVPYDPDAGISVCIDGVYNTPRGEKLVVAFTSVTPIAAMYSEPPSMRGLAFTRQHEWELSQKHQVFGEDFVRYRNMPFDPKMTVIVDVRRVVVHSANRTRGDGPPQGGGAAMDGSARSDAALSLPSGSGSVPAASGNETLGGPFAFVDLPQGGLAANAAHPKTKKFEVELEPYGWGLLPVFDVTGEGYVQRGAFRVPLLKGAPSREVITALRRGRGPRPDSTVPYALEILKRAVESSKIQPPVEFLPTGGVAMVRIMDSQLEGIVRVGTGVYRDDFMMDAEVAQRCTVPTEELEHPPRPLLRALLPSGLPEDDADQVLRECIAMRLNSDFLLARLRSGQSINASNTSTSMRSGTMVSQL